MLRVAWFDRVNGEVDEAIKNLPEPEMCPRDTYRQILEMEPSEEIRIAVVTDNKVPIAVSGMIRRSRFVWEPISNWLCPGMGFPASHGRHLEALSALGMEVPIAWWRMPETPPRGKLIEGVEIKPTYRMTDLARREEFWKSTDYLRQVRKIRNRTKHIEIRFGATGFVHHIVAGWHARWIGGNANSIAVKGRELLAARLEPLGKHVTVSLLDDGKLIAGGTCFVHNGMLVAGVSHLDPDYRKLGAGVRVIDALFDFAEDRGLCGFDLGGGADYKQKWAPETGQRAKITISHLHTRLLRRCAYVARRMGQRIPLIAIAAASAHAHLGDTTRQGMLLRSAKWASRF